MKKNKGKPATERLRAIENKLKNQAEQLANLNAYAMQEVQNKPRMEVLIDTMATCVTLLIKDCIGRGLSEEETAALTEALDGKKGETNEASQSTEGQPVPATGDEPRAE
jgi:hypothetical protein